MAEHPFDRVNNYCFTFLSVQLIQVSTWGVLNWYEATGINVPAVWLTHNNNSKRVPHSGCAVFAGLFQLLASFCILLAGTCWVVQWSWFAWVNVLCNFSCKKSREVAASLLGRFLSRRCFMLCITMEVEPRIAKQYKSHHCCSCKNYRGKGMEGEKKVSLPRFLADQKITISWKKCVLGHPIAQATSYCLLPDTFWLWASKYAFKVGSVKFTNSLSLPSIVKKVCTGSKSSQGT